MSWCGDALIPDLSVLKVFKELKKLENWNMWYNDKSKNFIFCADDAVEGSNCI